MGLHRVGGLGSRDAGVQWEDIKIYGTVNGMAQEVSPQLSTRDYDEVFCCMSMSSQGMIVVVERTYTEST
jgi:hypothetical protein